MESLNAPSAISFCCKLFNRVVMSSWLKRIFRKFSATRNIESDSTASVVEFRNKMRVKMKDHYTCWKDACWTRFWRWGKRMDAGNVLLPTSFEQLFPISFGLLLQTSFGLLLPISFAIPLPTSFGCWPGGWK